MYSGNFKQEYKQKNKAAQQLALGEKIRNAGDDASGYAISERMRVRIRSLDQADANVQNGASMLRVAEGAIQSQINLLRTVKAKVIDAHNDTNTDDDRAIIQKEITEYYNEINDIAAETTFNGKHLLLGTKVSEAVKSWFKLDHAEKLEGSDAFNFVSGSYNPLDGQEGPFAVFGTDSDNPQYDGYKINTISTNAMSGGTEDTPRVIGIDFGDTVTRPEIYNRAFKVSYRGGEQIFVLTNNMSNNYRGANVHKIDATRYDAFTYVVMDLAAHLSEYVDVKYDSTYGGSNRIILTTVEAGDITNDTSLYNVEGVALEGGDGYTAAQALPASMINPASMQSITHPGKDGFTATWTMNLSSYGSADDLIAEFAGKAIYHSGNEQYYEFIDSSKSPTIDSISKINGSTVIDLNSIRGSSSATEAFVSLVTSAMGALAEAKTSGSSVTGITFNATVRGEEGNNQKISLVQGSLRDYTIDFNSLLSGADIPSTLDGQGFRFYDATNANQWVNVLFVNGINPNDDERPPSGGNGMDIDTLVVDVSDVTSVDDLVRTLYMGDGDKNEQGLSQFLANSSQNFRVAADLTAGTITIYDTRKYTVLNGQTEKGAKIANGIVDNVVNDYRNTYVNDLVIQHTDKSSANIHVRIPQTTMDQIFGYKIGEKTLDDYSIMTSEKREFLLGQDYPVKYTGALDKGLQYLIDANTLIGAQIVHMENADTNIVTELENTTAAESVIRDADIAKSAMDMATANILSQSTMAMLSQFNHSSSDVLNLLQ
ncbi:flagellin N-terminal helical domain-containing protein [Anaerovibrio lipolyticus]|uniref:flagellin N-terminal helical domain-containing protein n=1 Tax=Anaerovibrio lipolyticus TaxID=82374 RepID=UPI002286AEB9|nr:flagellin [Anaerovibrio lipolyticus]